MRERGALIDAYLGVSSNMDPENNIRRALDLLKSRVDVTGVSTFYRCEAFGRPEQHDYLNGVCRVTTKVTPYALKFDVLRPIEASLGRQRTSDKYASRPIDLDIALYDDAVVDEPELHIPNPEIRKRPFLAVPLFELAPETVLPDTGESLAGIVQSFGTPALSPDISFTRTLKARLAL
jgi:dihydroneopterin aldolase/2-amino-4-hydroxy-6-hydroxymethyldihydropteridine diphosphokinase